ncbi:efflux transporter outer membrane subunit [Sphingomonas naphthae]|uniref:Efflux transporter outer membrane subunit n=1 Tax=Sphingomonas naphthae TaxID=1813468 RepID=A0ABY7TNV0_9SPHN|nr:efflux transporter outer membrane subunit [Sphingomonas naphthae]WCT74381.1 efflux transporter outer membrane subunit [Sphingomonas naphthae]
MHLPFRRSFAALTALALVSGCAVGPTYKPLTPAELKVPTTFTAQTPRTLGEADISRWWDSFGDPLLGDLVRRGLAANLDIAQAGARLRQARATLRQARADLFPTITASGAVSRTIGQDSTTSTISTGGAGGTGVTTVTRGGDVTIYRGNFDAAYEADLFGGIRRSIEQARANAQSSEAQLHNTQLSIASEIALAYVSARLAQAQVQVAEETLNAQDETLDIVGWRVKAGLVSSLDLEQSRVLRAQTAASIPTFRTNYVSAVNSLAVLLGEAPGAVTDEVDAFKDVPVAPVAIAAAIPADVIQRRPDVSAAERTAAAQTAGIGVAEAQLYPALRLSGSFGGSGTSVGDVFSTAIGSLLGSLSAPIFQGGRLRAQVDAQRGAAAASLAAYRQTVLVALQEVENALTALSAAEQREQQQIAADEASRAALIYAESQYRAGLIDFQTLLESQRSRLSARNSRVSARADRATATVQLYKALGGGWENAPIPETVSAAARAPATERP